MHEAAGVLDRAFVDEAFGLHPTMLWCAALRCSTEVMLRSAAAASRAAQALAMPASAAGPLQAQPAATPAGWDPLHPRPPRLLPTTRARVAWSGTSLGSSDQTLQCGVGFGLSVSPLDFSGTDCAGNRFSSKRLTGRLPVAGLLNCEMRVSCWSGTPLRP